MSATTVGAAADPVAEQLDRITTQLTELTRTLAAERLERERWHELAGEVTSLTGAGMGALSDALAAAESRGYFDAARNGARTLDRVVTTLHAQSDAPGGAVPSALALLRRLRDPQVRRGLALMLDLLQALGAEPEAVHTPRRD